MAIIVWCWPSENETQSSSCCTISGRWCGGDMWNPGSWTEELAPRVRLGSQHEIGEWWAKEFRIVFPGTLLGVSSLAFVKQGTPHRDHRRTESWLRRSLSGRIKSLLGRYMYVVALTIDVDLSIPTAEPHIQGVAEGPSRGRPVIAVPGRPPRPAPKFAWHLDGLAGDPSFTF